MYQPGHFVQTDPQQLHRLIRAHPLGSLVTLGPDGNPVLDPVPFLLESPPEGPTRLLAHVARGNPLWHTHPSDRPVLVSFHGPSAYISPNWYPTKAEHGKVVPTWNYAVVQAHGHLRVVDGDPIWLRSLLGRLTDEHEARQSRPWHMDDAPPSYINGLLQAVVGLEVEVAHLTGKFKLSQNQPDINRVGVSSALSASPDQTARDTLLWTPLT